MLTTDVHSLYSIFLHSSRFDFFCTLEETNHHISLHDVACIFTESPTYSSSYSVSSLDSSRFRLLTTSIFSFMFASTWRSMWMLASLFPSSPNYLHFFPRVHSLVKRWNFSSIWKSNCWRWWDVCKCPFLSSCSSYSLPSLLAPNTFGRQ